ncbi:MAG: VWA domain-containing protein [Methylomonas sp.]
MSFAEYHFLRPWWLLALPALGILLYLLFKHKQGRGNWLEVCDEELLPFLLADKPLIQNRRSLLAGGAAGVLAIIALAGPTWQRLPSPAFRNDSALVIALDLSPTMNANDIKPSRLVKARYKIADLLKLRKDGQTALLVYGGDTFTVTPLTTDTATISSQLEALTTDIMPSPGSNAGKAIRKAADLLRQAGETAGDILLITDSVDAESAAQAGKWLGGNHLSVLAVGTGDGAPVRQAGGGFVKDDAGNIVVARLDAAALAELARQGHGLYQPVTTDDEDIDRLQKRFNPMGAANKNQENNLLLQQWDEAGPWLLLFVLPWAALRFRKGLLIWIGLCLLPLPGKSYALDWQSLWRNPDQRAQQSFNQNDYQKAAKQFNNPDWRAAAQYRAGEYQQAADTLKDTQNADGFYNKGNALAKAGKLQEAIEAYDQALKLAPDHQDAKYNKELVEKQLREQPKNQDQDQQKSDKQSDQRQDKQEKQNKPEDNAGEQQAQQQQEDKQEQQKQADADKQRQQQKQSEGDKDQQDKDKQNEEKAQAQPSDKREQSQDKESKSASELEKDETQRANEQLLKRIPDEPTVLLKRKFRKLYKEYQYGQHGDD